MNVQPRQLPLGPLVAAAGALLLIASLFLDWYDHFSGFTVFEFLDLLLVICALATIASLAGGLGLLRPPPSPAASLAVALFTLFVVGSQVINDPPAVAGPAGPSRSIGIWLALGGALVMAAGALLGYARISLAFEARERPGDPPPRP